jgi:hypothetical protein
VHLNIEAETRFLETCEESFEVLLTGENLLILEPDIGYVITGVWKLYAERSGHFGASWVLVLIIFQATPY